MSVFSVPVTIGVDEEKIALEIHRTVESQVVTRIVEEIKGIIFKEDYYGRRKEDNPEPLRNMVEREVHKVIKDKEDLIIQKAAETLVDKMYRSKACREAMK